MPDRDVSDRNPVNRNAGALTAETIGTIETARDRSGPGRTVITLTNPETVSIPEGFGANFFPNRGTPGGSPFIGGPGTYTPAGLVPKDVMGEGPVVTAPVYAPVDPLSVLADVFSRTFGGQSYQAEEPKGPIVVGDAGLSSGGSSFGPLLILLVVGGGFAYYWFVIRKKGEA